MKKTASALCAASGVAIVGVAGLVPPALGQSSPEPAGVRIVLGYSLGIDVDSNRELEDPSEGTYAALVNGFDLAFLSNTRNQSLALTFGSDLRLASDPGDDDEDLVLEMDVPTVNFRYTREAANARLTATASYAERDVDTLEPFFIDVDGDTIVDETAFEDSEGTLTTAAAAVTLETGRNAPLGTTYTASYLSRTYSDTDDPDLFDREDYRVSATTRLRFSGVSTGRVGLSARQYEYSDGRDLDGETYGVTLGLARDLSPTLRADVAVGYSWTREEEVIDGETQIEEDEGPDGSLRLERDLANGTIFGSYQRDLVEDTFRNSLTFGRSLSMPRYDLAASVGLSALDGGDPEPTFGLSYARELANGQFTASLRRTVTVNVDDEERELTSAIFGYAHTINELSSFRVDLDHALVTKPGDAGSDEDETRTTLSASYSRAINRDWDLSVGYRARSRSAEDEDAFSNAVFLSVGRQFVFRP